MLRNRDQYLAETKQRLMSRLGQLAQQYTHPIQQHPQHAVSSSARRSSRKNVDGLNDGSFNGQKVGEHNQNTLLQIARTLTYDVRTLVLDSNLRNMQYEVSPCDFIIYLPESLRKVALIRIIRTELYQSGNTMGYFVLNDVKIPLQTTTIEHAYLAINDYAKMIIGNGATNVNVLGRIGPGSEIYPPACADVLQDPHTYVFRPVEPKLQRFHVRLLNHNGTPYESINNGRIIITLAAYCIS